MDGNKQQKTIPTVYSMSSSKAQEVFWAHFQVATPILSLDEINATSNQPTDTTTLQGHIELQLAQKT